MWAITHVGMSLGDGAWFSPLLPGVYEDKVQAVKSLKERFMGARTFLCAEYWRFWSR